MITDKFIHVHIPRTGGRSISEVLSKNGNFIVYNKVPFLTLDRSLVALEKSNPGLSVPSFCIVRNPWDWYVSAFMLTKGRKLSMKRIKVDNKEKHDKHIKIEDFHEFLNKLKEAKSSGKKARGAQWMKKACLSDYFNFMVSSGVDHIVKFENIATELPDLLFSFDIGMTKGKIANELSKASAKKSWHNHYSTYYTEETKQLVTDLDKDYIDQFGYTFEEI